MLHSSPPALFTISLNSRSKRDSQRHLSSDYELETLPSIDKNVVFTTSRESPSKSFAGKVHKDGNPRQPSLVQSQNVGVRKTTAGAATFLETSNGQAVIETPPSSSGLKLSASPTPSLAALQLQKEMQGLEIKKLELQLQLAQLQGSPLNSTESPPGKSLGDLKAPQKTLHPQLWRPIFAPGEPVQERPAENGQSSHWWRRNF